MPTTVFDKRRADRVRPESPLDPRPLDLVRLLDPDGERVPNDEFDPFVADITGDELASLYEDMLVVRRLDAEATSLQRQGELGLWPPLLGQEAAQIGSARTLRADDFVFSSYREHAVAYCRGVELPDLLRVWRGTAQSGWNPFEVGMATPSIVIGAQTLHAMGHAVACAHDGVDSVTVTYFGDGATSVGDVNEAMVFAASFAAPLIFFCQNNQWAISEPVTLQAQRPIAERAPGFGIPSVRVDGNDVLAVMAVTRHALERARAGGGPTFIEAVTYRMGPHTTSDDPSRYVDPAQRAEWAAQDPIERVESHLRQAGVLTDDLAASIAARVDEVAARFRRGCLELDDPRPLDMFDHVYAEPHRAISRQRAQYSAYLASIGDDHGSTTAGER
ncbi:MAG: pyruvate dehydrogenase (acetyl-transferring) E1 component subunit alpha [Microcella sp.]|nr:MAG: pyruvate dehydrogenase (acetyl-transferring) E1 component subunit alpha [Microcella sp.]